MAVAVAVEGLSKQYRIGELQAAYGTLRESLSHVGKRLTGKEHHRGYEEIWALRDVSFSLDEGETLGVVGRNGAGKSTLLKVLTRITTPTAGRAEIRGRVGSLLEVGTGFHPELTGRENIYLNGAILGMNRSEIRAKLGEIVEFSGVEKFLDTPVKRYSSGMHVRLAFSVAAHFEPEVLLVDEVLSVGDAEFQARCLGRMEDIGATGRTVLFVSHNMEAVSRLCDRAILLDEGRIVRDGKSEEVVAEYLQTTAGAGSHREWPLRRGAGGRARTAPTGARRRRGRGDGRLRRRSPAGRHRARLHRAPERPAGAAEDQARRGRPHRLQRHGHRLSMARALASRRLRRHGLDSGQLPERGARDRGCGRVLHRLARSSTIT